MKITCHVATDDTSPPRHKPAVNIKFNSSHSINISSRITDESE